MQPDIPLSGLRFGNPKRGKISDGSEHGEWKQSPFATSGSNPVSAQTRRWSTRHARHHFVEQSTISFL
jgi:hypothetical protein